VNRNLAAAQGLTASSRIEINPNRLWPSCCRIMIKVALPLVAWIYAAVFLVTSIASGLLAHLITDEIERQLPIDQRPSWRLLRARDHPL